MDKSKLIYNNFSMDKIEEAVDLLVQSYSLNNPFIKNGLQTPEALRKRVTQHIHFYHNAMVSINNQKGTNYQLLKVLIYKGQILAFIMGCQIHRMIDYRLSHSSPGSIPAQVFEFFQKQSYPENKVIFGSLLAVHKDYMKYKLSVLLLEKTFKEWVSYGLLAVAGVSNNPISIKVFQIFGGKIINVIKIVENGSDISLYMMINDLTNVTWPKL